MNENGKVYLIGAGPGAADLITVRGARLLAQADAVLYDALVTDEMLELCPQAEKINVGKRCGRKSAARHHRRAGGRFGHCPPADQARRGAQRGIFHFQHSAGSAGAGQRS
ncbi:MAG: uroporphyrin-III methyltransferase [Burkholderiaceae bacterium]|nr:uroporphyrin-III methyltransferase [Burkholderiaceae bacterium]